MKKVQQPKGVTFTEQDAVFGRKCGLRIPNTSLKTLITRHSDAYCGIVQHMAQDKRDFVVEKVMEPLLKVGGRFFISEEGVIKQLHPNKMKDQQTIITKIQQGLRDEKKKKLKATKSSSGRKSNNTKRQSSQQQLPRTPPPHAMPALASQQASSMPPTQVHQDNAEITDESVTTETETAGFSSLGSPVESTTTASLCGSSNMSNSPHVAARQQEEGSMDGTEATEENDTPSSSRNKVEFEEIDIAQVKELFEALRGKTISVSSNSNHSTAV